MLQEAMETIQTVKGQDAPEQIDAAENLARVLKAQGRAADAESLDRRIAELKARSGPGSSLLTGTVAPTARIE